MDRHLAGSRPSGTFILSGSNTYSGATSVSIGAPLQIGIGGKTGSLNASSTIPPPGTDLYLSQPATITNTIFQLRQVALPVREI